MSLLDREIAEGDRADARRGWNDWVTKVAIASLLWLLLSSTPRIPGSLQGIVQATELIAGLFWILQPLPKLFSPEESSSIRHRPFKLARAEFGAATGQAMRFALVVAALFAGATYLFFVTHDWPWVLIALAYLLMLASAVVLIILNFVDAIIRNPMAVTRAAAGRHLLFVLGPLFLGTTVLVARRMLAPVSLEEIKVAFLISGLLYLINEFSRDEPARAFVLRLHDVRRELLLGRLEPGAAVKQYESIAFGLSLPEALGDELITVLSLQDEYARQTELLAGQMLRLLEAEKTTNGQEAPSSSQAISEARAACDLANGRVKQAHVDLSTSMKLLSRRLQAAVRFGAARQGEIDEVLAILQNNLEDTQRRAEAALNPVERQIGRPRAPASPGGTPPPSPGPG